MIISVNDQNITKEKWDTVLKAHNGSFLQSWDWADILSREAKDVYRIYLHDETGEYVFLVIKNKIKGGFEWLYIPHMLLISNDLLQKLEQYIHKNIVSGKTLFLLIEPFCVNKKNLYQDTSFAYIPKTIQPKASLILDISRSEDEILKEMHQKTRYNIKRAKKYGVEVIFSKEEKYVNGFLDLCSKTAQRNGFSHFAKKHYIEMLKSDDMILVSAVSEGNIIAANILNIFDKRAIYVHGASNYEYHKLMGPYQLQWQSILFAKEKGCVEYDFWGVNAPPHFEKKSWNGFSRFKKGFSPHVEPVVYYGMYKKVYNRLGNFLYEIYKKIRNF